MSIFGHIIVSATIRLSLRSNKKQTSKASLYNESSLANKGNQM